MVTLLEHKLKLLPPRVLPFTRSSNMNKISHRDLKPKIVIKGCGASQIILHMQLCLTGRILSFGKLEYSI